VVIRRTVLYTTHFGVLRYLQDGPAYNQIGYTQDRPAYMTSDMIFGAQSGGCTRDIQSYQSDRQGNWHFADWGIIRKDIQLKWLKKRRALQELTASNCARHV